jgi:hypothetical protein
MNKKETNGGFKVSDKRHFAMEDDGTVKKRKAEEKAAETEAAAPAAEKPAEAPDIDLDSCECEEDFTELPPLDFSSFVFSLSTSTMIFLGILPDPVTEKTTRNLAVAKQHIDLLGMLQEKTAGNLTPDEAHFLEQSLYDLRMKFVEVCNPKP